MNSIWASLLWKEWREHRGKLAVMLATAGFVTIGLLLGNEPLDSSAGLVAPLMLLGVWLLSMFLSASIAASEQSQGTITFLQALPVSMHKPALAKLGWALATVWAPILLVVGVVLAAADRNSNAAVVLCGFLAGTASIMIWMAAVGVNLQDEVRAGAVGLLTVLLMWGASGLILSKLHADSPASGAVAAIMPAGIVLLPSMLHDQASHPRPALNALGLWPYFALAAAVHAGLIARYILRFGKVNTIKRQTIAVEGSPALKEAATLAPPRRSPLTATLWKQTRELLPLAGLGAAAIFVIAAFVLAVEHREGNRVIDQLPLIISSVWMMTGLFVSIVAGIGLLMDDLRPGLHTFWRSRPIHPGNWFWVKFVCGLLITIVTLAIPPATVWGLALALADRTERMDRIQREHLDMVLLLIAVQIAAFCLATALMAIGRRPLLAALGTILIGLGMFALGDVPHVQYWLTQFHASFIAIGVAVVAAVTAWLAVRNDWGWTP